MKDRSDKLDRETFLKIIKRYGPREVDLFASRLTHQCPRYFSWRPDPFAEATDAFLQGWTRLKGFANPPLEPDCQGIEESKDTGSTHTSDNPSLEDTAVVLPTAVHVDRWAMPSTPSDNQLNRASTPASRMEHLRGTLSSQGLSEEATELVLESWRAKTNKSYDSLFGRWNRWCNERGSDPFSGPVSEVANSSRTVQRRISVQLS